MLRARSGVEGIRPGMQVYGSDGQPIGVVDTVESNGLLVGGEFVPGNTIARVERDRVLLTQESIAFTRGEQRGDRDTPGTGPAPETPDLYLAQFSTPSPGTADRSLSAVTTVQFPSARAMAAIIMSICCIGRPIRRSSAAMRPYSAAASSVNGQTVSVRRAT